ncbi:MAG TPA: ABC transporter permease [Opitutaceae bacterium]|jgi:putative ABC transport system permease protein|nr:ABC transporter permease [Opitutaceae bacterium]
MISELRLAARSLLRTPGFTAISVLILAIGIGAVTAVFSAVEAVLLHPLPYSKPSELYCLQSAAFEQVGLFSLPEFCAYRDQNRTFKGIAAASTMSTNLVDEGEAQFVQGLKISAGAFDLLGTKATLGRLLLPSDDLPGAPRVGVISVSLWQRSFGGRADIIGRMVTINGNPCQIVGVLPAGFILPLTSFRNDVCIPLQADSDPARYVQGSLHFLRVFGRLAPGVTPAQALSDMAVIWKGLRTQYPSDYSGNGTNRLPGLAEQIVGDSRPMLLTLFGLVAALLLLASTNLAGLHLVRAISRQHDFALRTALGASRFRLMRAAVAESVVLAVVGGVAGLLIASWGLRSLISFLPANLPRAGDLQINGAIFAFAALVSLFFGLAPAFAPIWLATRVDLRSALAAGGRRTAGGPQRIRHLLASVQVALALALLVCTALFLRSFWAVSAQDLGFKAANTLTVRLSLPEVGYKDAARLTRLYDRLHPRLLSVPGVESVAATSLLPLVPGLATTQFFVTGKAPSQISEAPSANYRLVTPTFFDTMGIPLLQGRAFTDKDDVTHPLVVVIGAAIADAMFPNHDAVGQRIDIQDTAAGFRTATIVGISGNVKQTNIEDAATFDLYVPYRQMDPIAVAWLRYRTFWVLRGSAPAAALESALRREVHAEDSSIALSSVQTLAQVDEAALASRRFTLLIVGFFAASALLLTIAGIYSVIAFGVAQRTREIGVRIALGAKAQQVFGLVLFEGLVIVAIGAPAGLLASLGLSRLIAAQLYGVSPHDPLAMTAAVVMIVFVAFAACWFPARRASRVDPMVALRAE